MGARITRFNFKRVEGLRWRGLLEITTPDKETMSWTYSGRKRIVRKLIRQACANYDVGSPI